MQNLDEFTKYFQQTIYEIKRVSHNGNNAIYVVNTETGKFIFKRYFKHYDSWNRGVSEFNALSFLSQKELPVPNALKFYQPDVGIYSFNEGSPVLGKNVALEDIKKAAYFLARVHNFNETDKIQFGPASSACLSLADYIKVIDKRYSRIVGFVDSDTPIKTRRLVLEDVAKKIQDVKTRFFHDSSGLDLESQLSLRDQVLTPADFGFHNILKNKTEYTFIDFEYFGRDDPARQLLDFFHHGSSREISPDLKKLFLNEYFGKISSDKKISEDRLKILDPLIGITWALICLNAVNRDYNIHIEGREELARQRISEAEERLEQIK